MIGESKTALKFVSEVSGFIPNTSRCKEYFILVFEFPKAYLFYTNASILLKIISNVLFNLVSSINRRPEISLKHVLC